MIRKLAALISLAVVFSGSFALNTQSIEAKTSRNSSRRARNYFVPPPPPYIPTLLPSALGMTNAQAATVDDAVVEKEAKTSRNSSRRARNYLVPPPPPHKPSMVLSTLGMTNAQAVTAGGAVVKMPVTNYSKYISTRNHSDKPQVVRPNPYVSYNPGVEKRILKQIDSFDTKISSHEKEICKLLNL